MTLWLVRLLKMTVLAAILLAGNVSADDSRRGHRRRSVPEFDPASVGVVAAIIAGGGILIARRRR